MGPQPFLPMPGGSSQGENVQNSLPMSSGGQLPPIMSTCARGATTVQASGVATGSSGHASQDGLWELETYLAAQT